MKKGTNTPPPVADFTNFGFDSNWVSGTVGGYTFEAKLFDDPSPFGIAKGRVSKLAIYDPIAQKQVVNYDRGWDIKPADGIKAYHNAVMKLLESSPRRFDFENAKN
jgi:hypothetical protein